LCQKPVKISFDEEKIPGDAMSEKKEKKLKRTKVGKWRSLNVDKKQGRSNSEDSVTKGRPALYHPVIITFIDFYVFIHLPLYQIVDSVCNTLGFYPS